MNFALEIINALSFIFIILVYLGVPVLMFMAVKGKSWDDFSYRNFMSLTLFLILIALLSIAGMIITY